MNLNYNVERKASVLTDTFYNSFYKKITDSHLKVGVSPVIVKYASIPLLI